ncbi:liprin-alpha-1 isoform X2 [Chelonus insularis]|uniref:liprin-alpha-1 isoform X2 n=1 Tax=Chelonus insularis TaxID=460826 RepID=UPI00158D7F1B|nr:liprin-alpha-1 isoform X2 [Chelonus insularis]
MVSKRNERNFSLQSLHSSPSEGLSPGTRAPMTSPSNQPSSPRSNGNSFIDGGSPLSPSETINSSLNSTTSPVGDSRIPRPSPTALRRSSSMRVRGERVSHHLRTSSLGLNSSYQHHHRNNYIHQQPDIFPAITENGVDSPRHRSLSLSLTPARPRLGHAATGSGTGEFGLADDSDVDSVKSYGSACSTASACDHAHFARNGTTWSGRSRKYVVHCSNYNGDSEHYLTPTQRAARQIRKFQSLLNIAREKIEEKDQEILRLTKEVVELRLYKASLNSPDDRTDSSDALTVRENNPFSPESPCKDLPEENEASSPKTPEKRPNNTNEFSEFPVSLADSGHFEDESITLKDSTEVTVVDSSITPKKENENTFVNVLSDDARQKIIDHYESQIEEMHRRHIDEIQELKQKHNDKMESLLSQFSELNTRFCELRPSLDAAEAKVRELEAELERKKVQLDEQKVLFDEQEERNKQMYLKMYAKGQEAARLEKSDPILEQAQEITPKVSVTELLQQLSVTQAELENVKAMYRRIVESRNNAAIDPEITLQFLKSAIYYFLTDKENHHGHLNAIESILGFTDNEKLNIDRIYGSSRK